jgi:hypothetical protein
MRAACPTRRPHCFTVIRLLNLFLHSLEWSVNSYRQLETQFILSSNIRLQSCPYVIPPHFSS